MRGLNNKAKPERWTCIGRISAALSDKLQTSAALHFNAMKGYCHLAIISRALDGNTYGFYSGATCQALQKPVRSTQNERIFATVFE